MRSMVTKGREDTQTSCTKTGQRPRRKENLREKSQKNMHCYPRQRESLGQASIESEKESKTGVLGKGIETRQCGGRVGSA